MARAATYARSGHVTQLTASADAISATVRGTKFYEVDWYFDHDGEWVADCSCPVGFECKHAAAVAMYVLADRAAAAMTAASNPPTPAPISPHC